jgi:RNA polymerase sigma factor (sigma-70 family)
MCPAAPLPPPIFTERALVPLPGQPFAGTGVLWGMADLYAGPDAGSPMVETSDDVAAGVSGLFRARYPEMVRLADLLGADDPEDIAQEAFARLIRKHGTLRNPEAALAYVRASVCNLTRNRHRHLRVVRLRTPAGYEDSSEQVAMLREDHREVLAALAGLAPRRREAIVLRYWLDLSEREIAAAMGVSPGTVKSHVSRGLAALAVALGEKA